jgi:hypothetical protein
MIRVTIGVRGSKAGGSNEGEGFGNFAGVILVPNRILVKIECFCNLARSCNTEAFRLGLTEMFLCVDCFAQHDFAQHDKDRGETGERGDVPHFFQENLAGSA